MCDNCDTDTLWLNSQRNGWNIAESIVHTLPLHTPPWQHTSIWLSTSRRNLEKANGLLAFTFNQRKGFIYCESSMFLSVSVSHFPSAVYRASVHRQLAAVLWGKPAGTGICVKLHRHRRGALSDLLEEDFNSEHFNVFLGRQAGGYTGPHHLPLEMVWMVPEMWIN